MTSGIFQQGRKGMQIEYRNFWKKQYLMRNTEFIDELKYLEYCSNLFSEAIKQHNADGNIHHELANECYVCINRLFSEAKNSYGFPKYPDDLKKSLQQFSTDYQEKSNNKWALKALSNIINSANHIQPKIPKETETNSIEWFSPFRHFIAIHIRSINMRYNTDVSVCWDRNRISFDAQILLNKYESEKLDEQQLAQLIENEGNYDFSNSYSEPYTEDDKIDLLLLKVNKYMSSSLLDDINPTERHLHLDELRRYNNAIHYQCVTHTTKKQPEFWQSENMIKYFSAELKMDEEKLKQKSQSEYPKTLNTNLAPILRCAIDLSMDKNLIDAELDFYYYDYAFKKIYAKLRVTLSDQEIIQINDHIMELGVSTTEQLRRICKKNNLPTDTYLDVYWLNDYKSKKLIALQTSIEISSTYYDYNLNYSNHLRAAVLWLWDYFQEKAGTTDLSMIPIDIKDEAQYKLAIMTKQAYVEYERNLIKVKNRKDKKHVECYRYCKRNNYYCQKGNAKKLEIKYRLQKEELELGLKVSELQKKIDTLKEKGVSFSNTAANWDRIRKGIRVTNDCIMSGKVLPLK